MLAKAILIGCCLVLVFGSPTAAAKVGAKEAAIHLEKALESADHVKLYFVAVTERYSLGVDEIKSKSSVRIYRACGANCALVLRPIVYHLKNSTPAVCRSGQQNLLVGIGGIDRVIYSYSGRMIYFDGRCFFNRNSINNLIELNSFIFN